ncbi:hypothetical protein T11_1268 [Trichinella zimbabwensis]|uniref:Uncharacterized protein n=1 Tax=Trichinella zimbabwensis TaxID=268475 RepID=A0A0V1H682_9BILA|nr:hypothetical protein T11_1268 [Trichinella zimbabwensis]
MNQLCEEFNRPEKVLRHHFKKLMQVVLIDSTLHAQYDDLRRTFDTLTALGKDPRKGAVQEGSTLRELIARPPRNCQTDEARAKALKWLARMKCRKCEASLRCVLILRHIKENNLKEDWLPVESGSQVPVVRDIGACGKGACKEKTAELIKTQSTVCCIPQQTSLWCARMSRMNSGKISGENTRKRYELKARTVLVLCEVSMKIGHLLPLLGTADHPCGDNEMLTTETIFLWVICCLSSTSFQEQAIQDNCAKMIDRTDATLWKFWEF